MLKPNTKAPYFTLPDQDGTKRSLKGYRGQWVVLYFYPKDDTPGCTKEACAFRDAYQEYQTNNIVILGVSKDSVNSHAKFAQKHDLPFTLLSDESAKTIQAYQALGEKKLFGKSFQGVHRVTYLIDPEGHIAKTYPKVKPSQHAQEILKDITKIEK